MVFPIVGGDGKPTGYDVDNSLRINAGDSAFLSRTQTAGNQRTFTVSAWVKRARLNDRQALFSSTTDGSNECFIWFDTNDELFVKENTSNSTDFEIRTTRKFTDPSAWYHIVVAYDTTNGTAGDRVRIYVNGVEETVFDNETQPDQNFQTKFNKNSMVANIGRMNYGQEYLGGYLAEIHWLDGVQYDPTYFGEFDDNNEWVPKKYTGGNYGTNGYYLQFQQTGTSQNASGIGADTSGQDNHFAVTNLVAGDINTDTCTNNFATMSPQYSNKQQGGAATFAEGNLEITTSYSDSNYNRYPQVYSTFATQTGKYYYEMKITTSDVDSFIGVFSPENLAYEGTTNPYGGYASTGAIYTSRGSVRINDGQTTGHGTFSQNDILGCALDLDNNKVYFHKNGTYIQSGDPAANSGGQAIPAGFFYGFSVGNETASDSGTMQVNTGNPLFTISSGNADANGFGNFEYAVPSGFFAMCTKNIGEL